MPEDDASKLAQLRAQLPAVHQAAFLNTGTCGPLPVPVAEAMAEAARHELEIGRANVADYIAFQEQISQTRAALGRLLRVDPDTIALTHNTTEGMNIITWGIEWQPGDEIVTTTLEHEGGLYPLYMAQMRRGISLRFADVGMGSGSAADPCAQHYPTHTPSDALSRLLLKRGALPFERHRSIRA